MPYERLRCIFSAVWAWDTVGSRQRRALIFVRVLQMNTLTPTERCKRMALISGKNTKPELVVRKIARSFGHRLRSHVADLPGKPDFVFPKLRKIIFVHGCYWHRHPECSLGRLPKIKVAVLAPYMCDSEISVHCCGGSGLHEP